MPRVAVAAVVAGLAWLLIAGTGCVSADKYRDLETAYRNTQVRLDQAETELQSERARANELAAKLQAADAELLAAREQVKTLQDARDRLKAAYDTLRAQLDKQGQALPQIVTVTRALPPALDEALSNFARNHPDLVEYDAQRGLLKWKADILFDLGSAELKPAAVSALQEFAQIVRGPAAEGFDAAIVGHTDRVRIGRPETRAKHPTNWHLSAHRAISVLEVLLGAGVDPRRAAVMGYGEWQPIDPSKENSPENRRVEIYLVKKGDVPGSTQWGQPQPAQPAGAPAPEAEPAAGFYLPPSWGDPLALNFAHTLIQ